MLFPVRRGSSARSMMIGAMEVGVTLSHATMAAIRYGYGLRPSDGPVPDADALLRELDEAAKQPPLFPLEGLEGRRQTLVDYFNLRKQVEDLRKAGKPFGEQDKGLNREADDRFKADVSARIAQAATSPYGFHERLASFWLNHFTVSADKSTEMKLIVPLYEAEAIRPHLNGHFSTLLKEVSLHPAMLIFLDQAQSIGPNSKIGLKRKEGGSNENFAREVMELHTLGVGTGYTQNDVRQMSLLLTGLTFDRLAVAAGFDANRAEPGSFTVLGKTYVRSPEPFLNAVAVLEDLARDPRTMRHISRQLYSHFISETPDEATIDAMVAVWKQTDGHLPSVYRTLLQANAAWDEPGQKFKLPFDYVVSTLRAVGASKDDIMGEDGKPLGPVVMPKPDEEANATPGQAQGQGQGMMTQPASVMPASAPAPAQAPAAGGAMAPAATAKVGAAAMAGANSMAGPAQPQNPAGKPQQKQPLGRQAWQMIATLGQPVWRPSDAAGFSDKSDHWFSAAQMTQRTQWARRLVNQMAGQMANQVVSQSPTQMPNQSAPANSGQMSGQGGGPAGNRADPRVFVETALADYARDDTIRVASQAPNRQSGLMMTLVSPEFNRR